MVNGLPAATCAGEGVEVLGLEADPDQLADLLALARCGAADVPRDVRLRDRLVEAVREKWAARTGNPSTLDELFVLLPGLLGAVERTGGSSSRGCR